MTMTTTTSTRTPAETTELVLAVVFTVLGDLLLIAGFIQLSLWLGGQAGGPTIEPVVLPVGAIFAGVGLTKLLRVVRLRALATRGIDADAEILDVTPTQKATNGQPWVKLTLRVHPPDGAPAEVRLTWLTRPFDLPRLVKGHRVGVRILPGRPHIVGLR